MNKPLHGIKVLDFSRLLPGPFCSYLLAELGAKVTVIHAPLDEEVLTFPPIRKNKKFLAINLKLEKNKSKINQLIKQSDIILEGFRPGVMERLGFDFQISKKIHPKIIYTSLTGYGQNGKNRAGHDLNYLAVSGVLKTLFPIQNPPLIPGIPLADLVGGMVAALQILAQLSIPIKKRKATYLDISMTDAVQKLLIPLDQEVQKQIRPVMIGDLARYQLYGCSDELYLAVAPLEEKFWQKFVNEMGIPDSIIFQGEKSLIHWLKNAFSSKPRKYWLHKLADPDLCVTLVK